VNHVARLIAASALPSASPRHGLDVVHVESHPRLTFRQYLGQLEAYGWTVPEVEYDEWRTRLQEYVADASNERLAL